jgi:hypothetical protein
VETAGNRNLQTRTCKQELQVKLCCKPTLDLDEYENNSLISVSLQIFFLLERANLFAICNSTFSKWWEG